MRFAVKICRQVISNGVFPSILKTVNPFFPHDELPIERHPRIRVDACFACLERKFTSLSQL
jgi:hypothetical protein